MFQTEEWKIRFCWPCVPNKKLRIAHIYVLSGSHQPKTSSLDLLPGTNVTVSKTRKYYSVISLCEHYVQTVTFMLVNSHDAYISFFLGFMLQSSQLIMMLVCLQGEKLGRKWRKPSNFYCISKWLRTPNKASDVTCRFVYKWKNSLYTKYLSVFKHFSKGVNFYKQKSALLCKYPCFWIQYHKRKWTKNLVQLTGSIWKTYYVGTSPFLCFLYSSSCFFFRSSSAVRLGDLGT